MKAERLLTHYDRIADAPDAVPRLRRFILDLAVRGRLVSQDPNDEPAAELLTRISAERARLAEAGGIRPPIVAADPAEEAEPFPAPSGWSWVSFGRLIHHSDSGWSPRTENFERSGDNWGVLKVSAVSWDRFLPNENKQLLPGVSPKLGAQVHEGDFLISRANTSDLIAKCVLVDHEPRHLMLSDKIVRLRLTELCDARFVLLVNNGARHARTHYAENASGVSASMKNISRPVISELPLPLPPLPEQRRIVAKVDELMALCDRLEATRREREATRDRLASASLARLNAPDADGQRFTSHARFALGNLASLTKRPDQIKEIRRTILNLAVRGLIVRQDPRDGSVLTQLALNDGIREDLAKEDARADSRQQDMLSSDARWSVPDSWGWRALSDLALFIDYRGRTPKKAARGVRLLTAKNVKKGFINLVPEEFVSDSEYRVWMTRGIPIVSDVLFTTEAPMGNAAVVRITEPFGLAQRVICLRSYGAVDPEFLVAELLAEPFQTVLGATATGLTAQGIKGAKLRRLPIAVPPLAEQRRIVAKVDELMALCDRLESSLATADDTRRRLLDALLAEAVAPVSKTSGAPHA